MPIRPFLLAFGLMLGAAGCTTGPLTVPDDVRPLPEIDRAAEQRPMDERLDSQTVARNFVQVVQDVEPVAERECRRRAPAANCDFRIVVDDRTGQPPNAFQTVDQQGRPIIAFTLSLIGEARNRDELAFVMSHEAAHHILGHLLRQARNANAGAEVFGQLAGALGATTEADIRTAQQIGAAVGARSYSKDFELEADELGTIITHNAGYDPLRGADFFFRIPDPGDRFLGTHPPNAARVQIVRQTAARY